MGLAIAGPGAGLSALKQVTKARLCIKAKVHLAQPNKPFPHITISYYTGHILQYNEKCSKQK